VAQVGWAKAKPHTCAMEGAKKPTKSIKQLPVKEKPLHIPLAFEDALQIALNTPIKKSKIKKK